MFTRNFWKATLERSVKTFAQTLAACLAGGVGLWDASWSTALSVAGMTAVLSVLTSLASIPVGSHESPSLLAARPSEAQLPGQRVPAQAVVPAG
jgi:hypothetical protein